MSPYRSQTEEIVALRAENRAIEAQRAAHVEPTPGPAGNDSRRWVGWWPALAGLALAIVAVVVAMAWLR